MPDLQTQVDQLFNELKAAQLTIQTLERRNGKSFTSLVIVVVIAVFAVGPWVAHAVSKKESPRASVTLLDQQPTKVKAPFEVVDEQGRTIMRVRDSDGNYDRGVFVYNESGRSIADITSISEGGGGGKLQITADGAERTSELGQASGVIITGERQTASIQLTRDGKKAVLISADPKDKGGEKGGSIQVYDAKEQHAATLENGTGGGSLKIFGGKEKAVATLENATSGGSLKIFGTTDKAVATLENGTNGGSLKIFGSGSKPSATIETEAEGGTLKIFGTAETPVATLQSDKGEGTLWINDKSGKQVAGVLSTDSGGVVKVMMASDSTTYTAINAVEKGLGLAVRKGGVRKAFVGAGGEGNGAAYVYSTGDDPVAGMFTYGGGKGIVSVFSKSVAIAFLAESDKHAGGGSVTATDPAGNGIFSAGFTGEGGDVCVDRKGSLKCLSVGLPLQIEK